MGFRRPEAGLLRRDGDVRGAEFREVAAGGGPPPPVDHVIDNSLNDVVDASGNLVI